MINRQKHTRQVRDAYSLAIMPDPGDWFEVGERHICRHERRTEIPYCTEMRTFGAYNRD